jgi:glycosyltransferase involved in cell wall biosynthesis
MKILHVIPSVAARYGGPSLAIFPMCQALAEAGCEVQLCTTNADGEHKLPVEIGRMSNYEGVATIFFPSAAGEFKYSRGMAHWLDIHIAEFEVIHIHAVFNYPSLAAARAARKHRVPYIVRPLGTLDPWCMQQKPLKKNLYWRAFGKHMIERGAAVHYTTAAEQRAVEQSLKVNHGVVIPLGVDLDISRCASVLDQQALQHSQSAIPNSQSANPYVLFMSRLHPKKGLEVLIEAFASLLADERLRKWKLLIAGDGDAEYVQSLKSLVNGLGAGKSIIFAGWLAGTAKSVALQDASLLALPSYQENFGICVMEAMACGVPVLVSPHVNLASEIERVEAGWIAQISRDDLRLALNEALSSATERTRRARAAQTLSEEYGWPIAGKRLIDLYETLVV